MKIKLSLFVFIISIFICKNAIAADLNICTDKDYWYPYIYTTAGYTYSHSAGVRGLHIDIVSNALKQLNYTFKYKPLLWLKCLRLAKTGKYDAVVSGAYTKDRAKYFYYPKDAATAKKSKWRISQVEYVAINNENSPYVFKGNINTLPIPIRAPEGYSILKVTSKLKNI